ncbi:MAG: TfoX/Sxy family protein [Rhodothermaceae bacterium]|nr:TfoX/Sxy family protein [Rhodothermaceae bacterium]
MSNEDASVEELKNIGPKTADLLHQIEISTKKNLVEAGPVLVYKILQHRFPGITLNALYALYGAAHDLHWTAIPVEVKKQLKEAAQEDLDIDIR